MMKSRKKTSSTNATFDFNDFDMNLPLRPPRSPCASLCQNSPFNHNKQSRMSSRASTHTSNTTPPNQDKHVIDNQRLRKQNQSLQAQLQQKDDLIKELRIELDEAVMVNTKTRLEFRREVERAVQIEIQSVMEREGDSTNNLQQQIYELQQENAYLKSEICDIQCQFASQRQSCMLQINRLENELATKNQNFLTIRDELLSVIAAKQTIIDSLQEIFRQKRPSPQYIETFDDNSIDLTYDHPKSPICYPPSQIRRNR